MTIPFVYGILIGFFLGLATFSEWAFYQHRKSNEEGKHNEGMLWVMYIADKEKRVKENAAG